LSVAGRFITLEGGEGAGKTTQIRRLAEALRADGQDVLVTREPGGSPGAEEIRGLIVSGEPGRWDPVTEALLLYAARRDHLERTIRPALAAGRWVRCDRFADSTMAYQGYGHGLGRQAVLDLHRASIGDFRPDLTLILDLPVEVGLRRAAERGGAGRAEDRFERMGCAFHQRLREGFLDIARHEPGRCRIVDAARDPDAVAADLIAAVRSRFVP
jgi:dTMP kinase